MMGPNLMEIKEEIKASKQDMKEKKEIRTDRVEVNQAIRTNEEKVDATLKETTAERRSLRK
jgi:hypothetical protein